ncbi:MAG TPA: YaiI/YqxD family protein [Clostridia bacterium]|nr:YaiI/YqxD family protein [Clostridia bacterium]
MKILVDADACPVKDIIIRVANEFGLRTVMFANTSHMLDSGLYEVITVDKSMDSVDLAIINMTEPGDIVITQDYGLAALALGRKAYAINFFGLIFTDKNIDRLLYDRHITKRQLRGGNRVTAVKKRTKEDDRRFEASLRKLIKLAMKNNQSL